MTAPRKSPRSPIALAYEIGRGVRTVWPGAWARRDAEFLVSRFGTKTAAAAVACVRPSDIRFALWGTITPPSWAAAQIRAAARMVRRIENIIDSEGRGWSGDLAARCHGCGVEKAIGSAKATATCGMCSRKLTSGHVLTANGPLVDALLRARTKPKPAPKQTKTTKPKRRKPKGRPW